MSDTNVQHKNFESDTVHGHNTFVTEIDMHSTGNRGRSENANKVCDDYHKREMQKEREGATKKTEYRDYLQMQMRDKDVAEKKSHREEMSSNTPFSGDSLNANEKYSLKMQKQKDTRQDLDDGVRMKHDCEMKSQSVDREEAQERSDYWKHRHDDNVHVVEKAKRATDSREHLKHDVALLWMAEERQDFQRDIHREKLINALLEKDKITDLNEHQKTLLELQESIYMKRELLAENEDKINEWMRTLELAKNEQEKLKKNIEKEEELEKKLILKRDAMPN